MVMAPEYLPGPGGGELDPIFGTGGSPDPMLMGEHPYAGMGQPASPVVDRLESLPGDLYPQDPDELEAVNRWCQDAFTAAEAARLDYEVRWVRYYKHYRSYVQPNPGKWNSQVFVSIPFWVIETVTPRLVAQLPRFIVNPHGPEDVFASKRMEVLLDWAINSSDLYAQLVMAMKSALIYGTGILKTFHRQDVRRGRRMVPVMQPVRVPQAMPVMDPETGLPMSDMNGEPMVDIKEVEIGQMPAGMRAERYSYVAYDGPAAECVDLFNFWVAPEATDVQSARYVCHRVYRERSYLEQKVKEGVYRLPPDMDWDELVNVADDPHLSRLSQIGYGSGQDNDPTRKACEVIEFWLDDGRKMVWVNRKAIMQVIENPFDHSEKPFIRIVDYLVPHEFWGVGELEPLEGLVDLRMAMTNARIDNVRLVLNKMFAVNTNYVEDISDFRSRPGGMVRIKGDMKVNEVFTPIDFGDVTQSAYQEAQGIDNDIEKVSGISAYQMGLDSPQYNSTATGAAIITEQGASRFGLKSKLAELLGYKALGRHYGSILQQFTTEERLIRLNMVDPQTGMPYWDKFDPASIQGALDYDIASESSTQTQSMRQDQKMNLLNLMASYAPQGVMPALEDVLEAFGVKDVGRYLYQQPAMPQQPGQFGDQGGQMGPQMGGGMPMPMGGGMQSPDMAMAQLGGNPAMGTSGQMQQQLQMMKLAELYNQSAGAF
jgi:hypothetical protein